jgi:hypothetical protein
MTTGPSNNGLQLTRSARCALRATDRGHSLRAALAAEAECCTRIADRTARTGELAARPE